MNTQERCIWKWKWKWRDVTYSQVWWPILGIRALHLTHPKCTHTAVNTHTPWTHTQSRVACIWPVYEIEFVESPSASIADHYCKNLCWQSKLRWQGRRWDSGASNKQKKIFSHSITWHSAVPLRTHRNEKPLQSPCIKRANGDICLNLLLLGCFFFLEKEGKRPQ